MAEFASSVPKHKVFDARLISCAEKHALIFQRWSTLPIGDYFVLLNDHRPEPLRAQFQHLVPGCFTWTELETAGDFAAVRIERVQPDPAGFDASKLRGCGTAPSTSVDGPEDGVLAYVEIDTRQEPPPDALARIVRLSATLQEWMELITLTAGPIPELESSLPNTVRISATKHRADGAVAYHIRRRGSEGKRDGGESPKSAQTVDRPLGARDRT